MFCLCGGGGRKDKTRQDFVSAVAGFDQGIAVDHGSTSGSNSTPQHGRDDREAAVEGGHEDLGQQNAPPPYSEVFARNVSGYEKRPSSPPKAPELPTATYSEQKGSMPMLASPEDSVYFGNTRDDDAVSQRPGWIDRSYSQHKPNLVDAENQTQLGSMLKSKPPGLNNDHSFRPGWINQSVGVDAQSVRPGWIDDDESVAEQSIRPGWIEEAESVAEQSVRPGWMDETGSVTAQSVRPGWMDDTRSVATQSVRPGWIDETESVAAQSVRPGWIDETESVAAQSVRPGWIDETESVAAQSVRPGWIGETESVAAQSTRPGWMDDTGSVVQPSWIDETASGTDDTEPTGFGARQPVVNESESVRPGWMHDDERTQPRGWFEKAAAASARGQSGGVSPRTTLKKRPICPETTRGGQSSSEGAERPRSELADSPKETKNRVTAATPTGSRITHDNGSGSEIIDEGGLLGLIQDTNEKEAIRRKNERLRSAERTRRVFSSSPAGGIRKGVDEFQKQQTPRQGTAEAAKVRIVRSKTMPMAEGVPATPPVAVRAKRSSASTPLSPATERHGSGFKASSPTLARTTVAPSPTDINKASSGGIDALPKTVGVRARKGLRDGANKTPPIPRAASTEIMPMKLAGAGEARRFTSFDGASPSDSPRNRGRRVSTPSGDPRARAPSSAAAHSPFPSGGRGTKGKRESSGSVPSGSPPPLIMKMGDDRALAAKTATSSEDLGSKGPRPSPHLRLRPLPESISDTSPPKVVITSSSPRKTHQPSKRRSSKSSKPKVSTECKPLTQETRPHRSSESSSTSSADSKSDTGRPKRRDRQPTEGRAAPEPVEMVRVRSFVEHQALAATEKAAAPTCSPSASKARVKTRNSKSPAAVAAANAAEAASAASTVSITAPSAQQEALASLAAPLSKPIGPTGRWGRGQQPFKLGTPRERRSTRNSSRPRKRTSDLPPLEEEVGIPTSPLTVKPVGGTSDVSTFNLEVEDSAGPGSAKDLAESDHLLEKVTGANATTTEDKDEAGKVWLEQRAQRERLSAQRLSAASVGEHPFRRRGPQRLSRSSSWDDGSSSGFHAPQAMFSPGRFNPASGALSWGGSVDDSWCEGSVRSAMTAGTRNSSSASVRGPSDRKVPAPQLSKSEKQTVERLKIKRSQVHFGYRTVGGSERVYKIELNGEMRAAKVINTLGMNKEEMAEVLHTFDAELLALSRINTPHIVKVYGASVSPAEIIVVSEFVEGGVLRSLLHNPRKRKQLTQRVRLGIAKDTASGMKSLYAHGLQHRHLSSNSILLTNDFRAKILGVGLTMTTELISFFNGEERAEEDIEDGLPWASREVLAGAGFSEKSDVYSFGIVLWELMQEDPCLPYAGLLPSEVVGAKYNGEGPPVPKDCPPTISRLMESCWSNLPAERPSFVKICEVLAATSL